MLLDKPIVWRGHKWNEIIPEDNKHMKKAGYDLVLRRPPPVSELKRNRQAVCGIDAKSVDLIAKYPRLKDVIKEL